MCTKYISVVYIIILLTGAMLLGSCSETGAGGGDAPSGSEEANEGDTQGDPEEASEQEGSVGSYRMNVVRDDCYTVTNGTITVFEYDNQYIDVDNQKQDCFTKALVIPGSVGEQAITGIAAGVFDGSGRTKRLESITLSDNIEIVGRGAFLDNDLEKLTIPASVHTIEERAFEDNKLSSVKLGSSVRVIKERAFKNNDLGTSLTIPDSVYTIGERAFEENELSSVKLGSRVRMIDSYAFAYNKLDKKLSIPNSVETIGAAAFSYNAIASVELGNGVETIGRSAFAYNKLEGDLKIPNTVKSIGDNAFRGADDEKSGKGLASVNLGDSVETIGNSAFARNKLSAVSIPKSVKKIWEKAFAGNPIKGITIDPHNALTIGIGAFPNDFDAVLRGNTEKNTHGANSNRYIKSERGIWVYTQSGGWGFAAAQN